MGEIVRMIRRQADVEAREVKLWDTFTTQVPEPWEVQRLEDERWWCGDAVSGESAIVDAAIAKPREDAPSEALQDFTMDGFVTLRLPLRWRCRQEGEGWYCSDPDGRPGRLWAGYDLFMPDGGRTAEALAHQFAASWEPVGARLLSKKISAAPLGAVLQLIDEDEDGGSDDCQDPPLRCYRWLYFALRDGETGVMCRYTLMVPIAVANQPETQALIRLIGDEIQRQQLEETAASWSGSAGGRPHGPRNARNISV